LHYPVTTIHTSRTYYLPISLLPFPGLLDLEEFTVAMQLVEDVKEGKEVPEFLPDAYVPRGKRAYVM
jgi:hypothetical protein